MKYTHSFQVKASAESIYKNVLAADRWLSFVRGYQGLESGDPEWPNEGSSIVVRFGLGSWAARHKVTVVKHEHGHRLVTHEDMEGRYTDDVTVTFQEKDGTTVLTFVNDTAIRSVLIRILLFPLRRIIMELVLFPPVKKRIKALVEV